MAEAAHTPPREIPEWEVKTTLHGVVQVLKLRRRDAAASRAPWHPIEWDAGQLIARTIVPWASEWLLHFEIFVATGRWHGGGHEPAVPRR